MDLRLTLEQQANLAIYKGQIDLLSQEQLKELLLDAAELVMRKDNVIRSLIKDKINGELKTF